MEPVITREIFDRLRQSTARTPEVLTELCRDYLMEARLTIEQLRGAVAAQDAGMLRDRAHYLKGSSMMIGAGALSHCCATLEQMGRNSEMNTAGAMLEQTISALQAVEAALAQELGTAVLRP